MQPVTSIAHARQSRPAGLRSHLIHLARHSSTRGSQGLCSDSDGTERATRSSQPAWVTHCSPVPDVGAPSRLRPGVRLWKVHRALSSGWAMGRTEWPTACPPGGWQRPERNSEGSQPLLNCAPRAVQGGTCAYQPLLLSAGRRRLRHSEQAMKGTGVPEERAARPSPEGKRRGCCGRRGLAGTPALTALWREH